MTVPGQVEASSEHFEGIAGMPTEQEIAKVVKALPPVVNGKHMSDLLSPCMEAGHVVKFSIEHGKWNFLKIIDTYSVQDTSTKEAYAGGIYVKELTMVNGHRIVVYDKHNKPIALAVQDLKAELYSKVYNIYATTPLHETDKAEQTQDGVAFYVWFQIHNYDEFHPDYRSVLGWNGTQFVPMFRVVPVKPNMGNNVIVDNRDHSIQYALVSKHSEGKILGNIAGWHVCVAPGADPLTFLTLAAVLDNMVGWFKT